jgi:hypothetical protein
VVCEDGAAAGEDAGHVGAAADLAVEALLRVADQICRQIAFGKAVKARMSPRAASRCAATWGSFSARASRTRPNCAWTEAAPGWS